jgi:RNA polymerase sigma factor (sigma-70 family)
MPHTSLVYTRKAPKGDSTLIDSRTDHDVQHVGAPLPGDGARPATPAATSSTATVAEEPWSPPSWEEVVTQHSARVYRLAYRLTGNPHDAEDLTQDVFIRVFRSLHSYTPGTFEGWLHRITTNVFLDRMRRKQRIRFDALPEDAASRMAGHEPSPEQVYTDTHLDDDIQRALDALAPEFRAAVVLCDIEGLSYEEIATTLGIKLGTVRSRIHRGRAHLRAALAHRAPTTPAPAPVSSTRPSLGLAARLRPASRQGA